MDRDSPSPFNPLTGHVRRLREASGRPVPAPLALRAEFVNSTRPPDELGTFYPRAAFRTPCVWGFPEEGFSLGGGVYRALRSYYSCQHGIQCKPQNLQQCHRAPCNPQKPTFLSFLQAPYAQNPLPSAPNSETLSP